MNKTSLPPSEERRLLHWGVAIEPMYESAVQYGDIVLGDTSTGRDLKLAEGVDNLHQQITAAIVTALGSDPLNMGYGFAGYEAMANEPSPIMRREQLRFAVLSVLQGDPRVQQVLRVLIGDEIELFNRGEITAVAPAAAATTPDGAGERYRTTEIQAQFTIGTGETINLAVGPVAGGNP